MSKNLGWTCTKCTYVHRAPGNRCVMCNELRVTREHMREFVLGKPIPEDCKPGPLHVKKNPYLEKLPSQDNDTSHVVANAAVKRKRPLLVNNPYAKKQKSQSSQQHQLPVTSNPPPPGGTTTGETAVSAHCSPAATSVAMESAGLCSGSNNANVTPARQNQGLAHSHTWQTESTASQTVTTARPSSSGSVGSSNTSRNDSSTVLSNAANHQQQKRKSSNPQQQTQQPVPETSSNPAPPFVRSVRPVYQPGPVPCDPSTTNKWIYPVSETFAKRQYQFEMSQTAVLHNTLVSLPTGLGKTLIAAVVMYNYYRWFPTGKVIFLAPTQPLVKQQVGACHDIVGLPVQDTAVLTGNTAAEKRTKIWKSRRVFYCTPQTVQRDLDACRLDASQIVCLVFDEAHKATGDYAYVKIVEQLTTAGAKFRLLALSATPGTSLAAIQQVIFSLRINRIEARTEDDPTVAPYIHRRDTEYIVVPLTSIAKKVECALNDIISPLLNKLRSSGALRSAGYGTVTSYGLMKASHEYGKRDEGPNMMGYFVAGQHFVQLRSDLQKHGLGLVRTKLQRLRQTRNRGPTASIVRGREFQTLWECVQQAMGCDSSQTDAKDKLANNPKLVALQEVLTEHFEKHRACSTSSRAIVFSQWRDSVSEIVSILEAFRPLIRPRCFVGQNAGAKTNQIGKLKGMKQAEQQEVIRQFREDVYNVLVCTSIGEEGLDIGQVDLIVNYDNPRSPIRTLQRVGRTGRKRNGRVVCLIAEGQEENTFKSSKQSERNLAHALRNPKSFEVAPTVPMFPSTPVVSEMKMTIGKNFRMSQVDGIDVMGKRSDKPNMGYRWSASTFWKLTATQEWQRKLILGEYGTVEDGRCVYSGLSTHLLRRFWHGRRLSRLPQIELRLGRTAQLLRHIEKTHGEKVLPEKEEPSWMNRRAVGRRADPTVQPFPLMPVDANESPANFLYLTEQAPQCKRSINSHQVPESSSLALQHSDRCQNVTHNKENEPSSAPIVPADTPVLKVARPQNCSANPYVAVSHGMAEDSHNDNARLQLDRSSSGSQGTLKGVERSSSPKQLDASETDQVRAKEIIVDEFVLQSQDDSDSDADQSHAVDRKVFPAAERGRRDVIGDAPSEGSSKHPSNSNLRNCQRDVCATNAGGNEAVNSGQSHCWKRGLLGTRTSAPSPQVECSSNDHEKVCSNNGVDVDDFVLPSQGWNSDGENSTMGDLENSIGFARVPENGDEFILPPQDSSSSDESASSDTEDEIVPIGTNKAFSRNRLERRSLLQSSGDDLCDTQSCQPSQRTSCGRAALRMGHRFESPSLSKSCGDDLCDTQSCQPSQQTRDSRTTMSATESLPTGGKGSSAKLPLARERRRLAIQRFFEEEARIGSDDDMDGDESESTEVRRMEEEEKDIEGFINDSSQLGYSPDALDEVDPEAVHKALDIERAKKQQFATPVFNRRMIGAKSQDSWRKEAPDSAHGLGNMNFIRSVLEHHKQGGSAEAIELFYHGLEDEEGPIDEETLVPQREVPMRTSFNCESSDSDGGSHS